MKLSSFRRLSKEDSARIKCGGHYRTNGKCPTASQATWSYRSDLSVFYVCDDGKASFEALSAFYIPKESDVV